MKRSQILRMTFGVLFLLLITIGCATKNAAIQTPKPETPAPVAKVSVIEKISFTEEENSTKIQIEGSEPIAPPLYKLLSDPLRIAIDVPNIDLKQIKSPLKVDNGTIGEVLTTQYDDKGRIEIGLLQMTNYNISTEENNLFIDVEKVKKISEEKEVQKEAEALKETKVEAPAVEAKKEETLITQQPLPKAKKVTNLLFEEKKDFIVFNILADGKIENFNAFKLDSPPRLVLDIWGVDTRKNSFKVKNPLVKRVRVGHYPDKLRLVFDSQKPQLPPYQVNRIDDKLIVALGNIPQPSEPQIYIQEKSAQKAPVVSPTIQAESRPKPSKASTLISIDFKQMDDKSRLVLSFSEENPQFKCSTPSKNLIAIDVKNAFVPQNLLRGLDTSAFKSVVNYVDLKNIKVGKTNDIHILVKLGEEAPYETTKEGKEIFVDIKERPKKIEAKIEAPAPEIKKEEKAEVKKGEEAKKEEAKKEEKAEVKKEEEAKREEAKKEEVKKEEEIKKKEQVKKEAKTIPKPMSSELVSKKVEGEKIISEEEGSQKVYKGRKLSLDFKDADIKNILRLIAEVSDLNIIVADGVTGKITMRLVDVPWDQALDLILQSKGLGMVRAGNVLRVAPSEALKKEVQTELEAKRAKEKLEDLLLELIPINYASGKEIMPQVKSVLSDRGEVKIDERTNTLIVKDIAKRIIDVKNLVKSLDTKTPQVLIEARIVEASLAFQRDLGISWGMLASTGKGNKTVDVGGGYVGTTSMPGPGTSTNTTRIVDLPAILPTGGSGAVSILEFLFTSGDKYGLKQLDIAISAYENKGDAHIISSPKIATLDNKEASIEQGLRIPYPKYTTEGTISTDFIDANIKLTVTPHVTNDGNIKMIIRVKKDAPDFTKEVLNVPSIDKKEAITEVLVKDNGVVAIAGIYTIDKNDGATGVPLFNKIPLLGWLFKKETKSDSRKDLLIFISPKIMKDEV
jgi:type IV pilus assembly protein PilQ